MFLFIKYSLNVKKILAVINATYAVAKRKPEKIRLAGIRTLTSAIPVQRYEFHIFIISKYSLLNDFKDEEFSSPSISITSEDQTKNHDFVHKYSTRSLITTST